MIVEKINNKYGISLDHTKGERLPYDYVQVSHLFHTFTAHTKAIILDELGIKFELEDETFFFTIDGHRYRAYSDDLNYRFFKGVYKAIARKVE